MIIVVNNNEYRVRWNHLTPNRIKDHPRYRPGTVCSIFNVDSSGKTGELVANGEAYLGKKDPYIKEKGRKISFARALAAMQLSKDQREDCWLQYFAEKGIDMEISESNRTRFLMGDEYFKKQKSILLNAQADFKKLPLEDKRQMLKIG